MQSNEYGSYDAYGFDDDVIVQNDDHIIDPATQQGMDSGGQSVDYNADDPKIPSLPRILMMGPGRGGKTSIQRVVFQKMSPHETLFRLEPTQRLERAVVDHTPLCRFTIWDFPGDYYGHEDEGGADPAYVQSPNGGAYAVDIADPGAIFAGSASLVFVVDAQYEPYLDAVQSFTTAVTRALRYNPNIAIEVFINKIDGELFLSDESKFECRRDFMTQMTDELTEAGVSPDRIQIRYHLTSIYDHTIYEALSRVVQRLIPQSPTLENLLNVLVNTCSLEKAYLFDVVSKLYLSTDPGPVDMQSVELCSDMIDVVLDVSGIYGLGPSHLELGNDALAIENAHGNGNAEWASNASNSMDPNNEEKVPSVGDELVGTLISQAPAGDLEEDIIDPDSAYDSDSASVIRLSNGMVLYLKEVDTMLALVCITRAENFRKKSLINYNIGCLKRALRKLVQPVSENDLAQS